MKRRPYLLVIPVAIAGVLLLRHFSESPGERGPAEPPAGPVDVDQRSEVLQAPPVLADTREESVATADQALAAQAEPSTPSTEARAAGGIHGYVEDLSGIRRAGCLVVLDADDALKTAGHGEEEAPRLEATTDAQGEFAFPPPPSGGYLRVASPGLVSLFLPRVEARESSSVERRILVVPSVPVTGTVTATGGAPIEGAVVQLLLPASGIVGSASAQQVPLEYSARTDGLGKFELEECPELEGASFWAYHKSYSPATLDAPPAGQPLHFVLEPLEQGKLVCGVVLDQQGIPAAGVSVSIGALVVETKPGGAFCVDIGDRWAGSLPKDKPIELLAVGQNARSEVMRLPPLDDGFLEALPDPLVLQLTLPRLALRGRVVDPDRKPLPGLNVDLVDPTVYGFRESPPGAGSIGRAYREAESGGSARSTTDAEGAFRLDGLEDRPYTIEVLDPRLLTRAVLEGAEPGGEDLEIVFSPRTRYVTGTVVDAKGEPLPSVLLTVTRKSTLSGRLFGAWAKSDEQGAFRLGPVQDDDLELRVEGGAVMPSLGVTIPREELEDARLVLSRRLQVRIDWSSVSAEASGVGFCDAQGKRVTAALWGTNNFAMLQQVRSRVDAVYAVPEEAVFAVLLQEDVEVGRVRLEPSEAEQLVRF